MGRTPIRHFDPSTPNQGTEPDMDYKTIMVSLALDRSNDACVSVNCRRSRPWPLKAEQVDLRGRDATAHRAIGPLFPLMSH
jgi:hypothetical protein